MYKYDKENSAFWKACEFVFDKKNNFKELMRKAIEKKKLRDENE